MNKEQIAENQEVEGFKLKPVQELQGFDFDSSDAFVCDVETGICGPVNKEKESK